MTSKSKAPPATPIMVADNDGVLSAADRGVLALSGDWLPDLQKARVYEQILLDIILGELASNTRLDEQVLARRYNSGLAGVRDALGRLALEGLVLRRARSGTTVSALDLVELNHSLAVREQLEPQCAALAATNGDAAEIDMIVHAFDGAEAAVRARDSRTLVAMDQQFHSAIAKASRNTTLARIVISLQHNAARYWVYTMNAESESDRLAEVERHRELAAAIARRDGRAAQLASLRILKVVPRALRRSAG